MRALLDVDGVLADFTGAYLQAVWEVTGERFSASSVDTWEIKKWSIWTRLEDMGMGNCKRKVDSIVSDVGFCQRMAVLPGAVEAVSAMRAAGVDLVVVTSPWLSSPTWAYDRMKWLKREFGFEARDVVMTPSKHVVCGDVLVDDKVDNCVRWWREWRGGEVILFAGPHNEGELGWTGPRGGWDTVLEAVLG